MGITDCYCPQSANGGSFVAKSARHQLSFSVNVADILSTCRYLDPSPYLKDRTICHYSVNQVPVSLRRAARLYSGWTKMRPLCSNVHIFEMLNLFAEYFAHFNIISSSLLMQSVRPILVAILTNATGTGILSIGLSKTRTSAIAEGQRDALLQVVRPRRGAKYCNEYVSLSVPSHISKTTWPNFTKFCVCCLCRWLCPPLMALRYVRLCTSRFLDDVMFSHNRFYGTQLRTCTCHVCVFLSSQSVTDETTASTPMKFYSARSTHCGLRTRGEICSPRLPC